MGNSKDGGSWCDRSNAIASIDNQAVDPDFDFWSQILFPDPETQAQGSRVFVDSSIDSIIMASPELQENAPRNHDLAYDLDTEMLSLKQLAPDTEMLSLNQHAPESYDLPIEDANGASKKEMKELREAELVTVNGQFQTANSELYTIKSSHRYLLR